MSKPRRFKDKEKAASKPTMRPESWEGYKDRHSRRLQIAGNDEAPVREWCHVLGISFRVANEGHHWIMKFKEHIAEWWPSTAKLVIDKQFKNGIHTHTFNQLLDELTRRWKLIPQRATS